MTAQAFVTNGCGHPLTVYCGRYTKHSNHGICVYCEPEMFSFAIRRLEVGRRSRYLSGQALDDVISALRLAP